MFNKDSLTKAVVLMLVEAGQDFTFTYDPESYSNEIRLANNCGLVTVSKDGYHVYGPKMGDSYHNLDFGPQSDNFISTVLFS